MKKIWLTTLILMPLVLMPQPVRSQIISQNIFEQQPLNRPLRDIRNDADTLLRLGEQEERRGSLAKAIPFWVEALELYTSIRDEQAMGRTLELLGITYGNLGQLREAEAALRQRIAIARDNRDFTGQIFGLNNLGVILIKRRGFTAAETVFVEALTLARSIDSIPGQGLSLSNLGLLAFSTGDFDEAAKRYEASLTFRRRGQDPLGEVNTLVGLADAYRSLNQYREAIINYFDALETSRIARDIPNQFRVLTGMHSAYLAINQPELALQFLDQRMLLAQQTNNLQQELSSLIAYGRFYGAVGDRLGARTYLERAIALAANLGETGQEAALRNELAQVIFVRN